ncbi:hypothetical protein LINPERHAP1_LOCUS20354, partial [Linum perenne]
MHLGLLKTYNIGILKIRVIVKKLLSVKSSKQYVKLGYMRKLVDELGNIDEHSSGSNLVISGAIFTLEFLQ